MKALSIQQPWAWAIVHGGKDIENRSWGSAFRGRVLIHASKKYDVWGTETVDRMCPAFPGRVSMQLGGIIGVAEVVDCVTDHDSQWFSGRFGFVLRDARPLPFIPCHGKLGFFDVEYPYHVISAKFLSADAPQASTTAADAPVAPQQSTNAS